jgi:hypothetical protein
MRYQAQAHTRELPRLRGGLPWLGHALAFRRDPETTRTRASESHHGSFGNQKGAITPGPAVTRQPQPTWGRAKASRRNR